jgi:phosphoribosylaminoimidazole-succinocarboxamide synthase
MNNSPSPDAIIAWNVILTIGVLVTIVTNVLLSIRSTRQQKREVTMADALVTTDSCRMLRNTSDNRIHRLEQDMLAVQRDLKTAIDDFQEQGEERSRRIHERIDDIPNKMVALLKNTGAIK